MSEPNYGGSAGPQTQPQQPYREPGTNPIDFQRIKTLMLNPLKCLEMSVQNHFLTGILGIAAVAVGFLLCLLMIHLRLSSSGGILSLLSDVMMSSIFKLFILGLFSQAVLLGAVWFIGNVLSGMKLDVKQILTTLGGVQWLAGGGIAASAVITLVIPAIGIMLMFLFLLIDLVFILIAGIDLYNLSASDEKKARMVVFTIGGYGIVTGVLFNLIM